MPEIRYFYIKTFGCQMNEADAERVIGWYEERGWVRAEKMEEANEFVIVTCSVRQSAENRVMGLVNNISKIKSQKSKRKEPRIILTGCMLYHPLRWLKEKMPGVDEFRKVSKFQIDNDEKIMMPEHYSVALQLCHSAASSLVPIMNGCSHFCSYCVVPYARGREVSRPFGEIVCEVKQLARRGVKEIILLGQNVNSFGRDFDYPNNPNIPDFSCRNLFASLLRALHDIKGIEKISFLTSNPWDLSDEIIEAMTLPKIDRYFHLAVQSGDDEILKKMNRGYTVGQYVNLVEKLRRQIPGIKIGTDIIVGFPGETEEAFNNTVKLCRKIGFEKAYIAMYSPRQKTAASKLTDNVPHKEKERRRKVLDMMINKKAYE